MADAEPAATAGAGGDQAGDSGPADGMRLPEHFQKGTELLAKLDTLSPMSAEAESTRQDARKHLEMAAKLVRALHLFSANEDHSEHSASSLRYLLLPALQAKLAMKTVVPPDHPERDALRLTVLARAKDLIKEYFESCNRLGFDFAADERVSEFLDLKPGTRRDRDKKLAHTREVMSSEKMLKELVEKCKKAKEEGEEDEDLEREQVVAHIHTELLQACSQLEMIGTEQHMLEHMQAMRKAQGPPADGRPGSQQDARMARRPPPEKPVVLTKEMIAKMSATGESIDRANFKLVTRGYGPIGAPTMTMDELFEMEVAQGKIPAAAAANARAPPGGRRKAPHEPVDDPEQAEAAKADSDEDEDAKVMRAREMDEFKDTHRRGDGNRYNKG